MSQPKVLRQATISPNAARYNTLSIIVGLSVTIVGIPLLLIAVPISVWYWSRYYDRLSVILTTRELKVHRGILNKEEKSIPLEKITDLAVFQGPIMRAMNLKGIRVETAGQSSGANALVRIVGIENVDDFRDTVLTQRDRVTDRESPAAAPSAEALSSDASPTLAVLTEIRDSLHRLEARLAGEATGSDRN